MILNNFFFFSSEISYNNIADVFKKTLVISAGSRQKNRVTTKKPAHDS